MSNNQAHFGVGGITVGVLFYETDAILDNVVSFRHTNFTQNYVPSGAGMYFFSSRITLVYEAELWPSWNLIALLRLFSGSYVSFINNYASELGGAIYALAQDELGFFFSRSCFIHYKDVTVPAKKMES